MLQCMIKLDTVKIPDSYNGSTTDSDSVGSSSILLSGAIPLSITVSTAGSNPAGVGSTPNRGCQGDTVGNRM